MKETDEMGATIKPDSGSTCTDKYMLLNFVITDDAFSPTAQVAFAADADAQMELGLTIPARPSGPSTEAKAAPLKYEAAGATYMQVGASLLSLAAAYSLF